MSIRVNHIDADTFLRSLLEIAVVFPSPLYSNIGRLKKSCHSICIVLLRGCDDICAFFIKRLSYFVEIYEMNQFYF